MFSVEIVEKVHNEKGYFLGITQNDTYLYLQPFSWDCEWYWGGGYIYSYYKNRGTLQGHNHFDSMFFNGDTCNLITKSTSYTIDVVNNLKKSALTENEWWRLLDLMTQFYAHRHSAECFQHGGHMTSKGRNPMELDKRMADILNQCIKDVIIPEVYNLFK